MQILHDSTRLRLSFLKGFQASFKIGMVLFVPVAVARKLPGQQMASQVPSRTTENQSGAFRLMDSRKTSFICVYRADAPPVKITARAFSEDAALRGMGLSEGVFSLRTSSR